MLERVNIYIQEVKNFTTSSSDELEEFRLKFLSKKGIVNDLFDEFRNLPPEQKRETGKPLNVLKSLAQEKYNTIKSDIKQINTEGVLNDLSRTSFPISYGSRHPLSLIRNEILSIFSKIGFIPTEGPEIEDDWHVFSALNFPEEHPARDMQDTFFIMNNPDVLLRTHTSSVQVRAMENTKPPIRITMPGRVFRNEAISARAHCIFHQVEGLHIAENVSFSEMKQTLLFFAKEMFGSSTKIRLRPSFFPFTEPSAEMDISCTICKGSGCNVCKYTGWLEIMGCGMVDPNVLEFSGINKDKYSGYAFGMGIERIAMNKFSVNDLRLYFENDVRFLNQFSSVIL
ncbi:MAG: phenylalanine--tRNA ligase subunit alpha [Bacteroidota bacterium]